MDPSIVGGVLLSTLVQVVHLAGLALFFAGIAAGMLLVFADRHGYERPVSPRIIGAILAAGIFLSSAAILGQRFGV